MEGMVEGLFDQELHALQPSMVKFETITMEVWRTW